MPNGRETKAVPGKGCPRCGFCVFEAEKLIAAGRVNKFQLHVMSNMKNELITIGVMLQMCCIKTLQLFLQNWHKRCFTCNICNRHLDSTTVNDGPDGEIYCKACYAGKFGIRGYGFGQGAGTPTLMCVSFQ